MEALVHQRKSLVLILVKLTKCCLSLHYNVDNSYLFINRKEFFKSRADNRTFQLNFVSKVYLMELIIVSLEKYF